MTRILKLTSVLVLSAFVLAACDDDDNNNDNDNDNGADIGGDPQDQFGSTFSTAFDADENDEPIDPQPGDIAEVSKTDDPVDF